MLWQTSNAPPSVGAEIALLVDFRESVIAPEEVVAVKLTGAALMVVCTPLMVETTGVTVEKLPLASTVTQGSKAGSVTINVSSSMG